MRRVLNSNQQLVAWIHQQRVPVWSERGECLLAWCRGAGWNSIVLQKGEIDGLLAIQVAEIEIESALQAVYVQSGTPMRVITTDVSEGRKAGRIELEFEHGRSRIGGITDAPGI